MNNDYDYQFGVGVCANPECACVHFTIFRGGVEMCSFPINEKQWGDIELAFAVAQSNVRKKMAKSHEG